MSENSIKIGEGECGIVFDSDGKARLVISRPPDDEGIVPRHVLFCSALAMWIQEGDNAQNIIDWFHERQREFASQLPFESTGERYQ